MEPHPVGPRPRMISLISPLNSLSWQPVTLFAMPRGYLSITFKVKVDAKWVWSNFETLEGKKMVCRNTKEWKEIHSRLVQKKPKEESSTTMEEGPRQKEPNPEEPNSWKTCQKGSVPTRTSTWKSINAVIHFPSFSSVWLPRLVSVPNRISILFRGRLDIPLH